MAASPTYTSKALARRSAATRSGDDLRHEFKKDRDRLLYTGAFRRLSGKSQVVASTEIGPFHTRLTHSLKVAQLGRRIAEQLRGSNGASSMKIKAPDPDLTEFACLAHDIGHPPFGHAGESEIHRTLDEIFASGENLPAKKVAEDNQLALGGFEGNPQSFRIVTRLAHKWLLSDGQEAVDLPTDWFGLDLTAASMDAVTKYPWERTSLTQRKWGAYGSGKGSDWEALEWARGQTGAEKGGEHKSFEAQLMDWCDDVTYAVHDVEDFFQIGLIPLHLLFAGRPDAAAGGTGELAQDWSEWAEFREYVFKKWNNSGRSVSHGDLDEIRASLMDDADGLVVWGPFTDSAQDRRYAHYRTSQLIQHFVNGVAVEGEPLLHLGKFVLSEDADRADVLRSQCDLLKELIWKYIIDSPSLATQQAGHRRIVRDLVTIYYEDMSLLPRHYVDMIDAVGCGYGGVHGESFSRIRGAADFVSSLTEPHAIALHQRLTGNALGGFRDLV